MNRSRIASLLLAACLTVPAGTVNVFADENPPTASPTADTGSEVNEESATCSHTYADPQWTWSDDHESATVTLTCTECGATKDIQATVTDKTLQPATCTQTGKVRHFASAVDGTSTWVDWKTDTVEKTEHSYGSPEWTWSDDHATASVKLTCKVCGATKEIQATVTDTTLKPATCTQEGKVRHFAKAVNGTSTWVDWKTDTVEKTEHSYDNPEWTWNDDHTSATVKLTCKVCGATKEIQATVTDTTLKPATCTQEGKVRHFAKAVDGTSTWVDWKTDTVEKTDHSYGNPEWTWSDDHESATVKLTCKVCGATTELQADVNDKVMKVATCTQDGKIRHFASAKYGKNTFVDWKTDTVEATGHNWTVQSWNWNEDNTKATVTIVCKNNKTETQTLEADVTSRELMPATCSQEGKTFYTAKAENPDKKGSYFVTFKTVKTPADPDEHAFDADVNEWTWNEDHTEATLTKTCLLCGKKVSYEAEVTKTVTKEATCTEAGEAEYTATVVLDPEVPEDTTKTDTVTEEIPAVGHTWEVKETKLNDDATMAEVTLVCKNDSSHTKTVEAVPELTETVLPTKNQDGTKTYTVTVTEDGQKLTGTADAAYKYVAYNIIRNNGATVEAGEKDFTFASDSEFAKFTGVAVDGEMVDAENYTAVEGSTVITLKGSFMKNLKAGKHTVTVYATDGEANGTFTVKAAVSTADKTADNTAAAKSVSTGVESAAGFYGLAAAAAAGLYIAFRRKHAED